SLTQGSYFNNKMWNALKLVMMWKEKTDARQESEAANTSSNGKAYPKENFAVSWFANRLYAARTEIDSLLDQYRLSEALKQLYSLIWDEFCSWYLEWVKPAQNESMDAKVYEQTVAFFTELLHMLHPFMPFITDEIYHRLKDRDTDLCVRQSAPAEKHDETLLQQGMQVQQLITGIRDLRNRHQIKPKEPVTVYLDIPGGALP